MLEKEKLRGDKPQLRRFYRPSNLDSIPLLDEAEFLNNSSSPKAKVCKSLVPRHEKTRVYTAKNTNGNADKGSNEDAQNGFVAHGTSVKEMKLRLLGHLEGLLRILLSKILLG